LRREGEYIKAIDHNIQELLAEAKAEEKRRAQTLTENPHLNTKESLRSHSFERKQISVRSAVFYEKFWVTGNTITVLKWNISFCRAGRNYKFSSDKLSLTETKLRYPHRRTAIVLSTI
jgi:hypothetical protein